MTTPRQTGELTDIVGADEQVIELDPIVEVIDGITLRVSDYFQTVQQPMLSLDQIRRIGALQAEDTNDRALEAWLESQERSYDTYSKDQLIRELVRRDRALNLEGRKLADGKTAGNLLREVVRGLLRTADATALKQGLADANLVDGVLLALGAEPADKRQLRLHGHTLGVDTEGLTEIEKASLAYTKAREDIKVAETAKTVTGRRVDIVDPRD